MRRQAFQTELGTEPRPPGAQSLQELLSVLSDMAQSDGVEKGRFSASVTVTWEFEWWINDVYQGVFGTLDLSAPFTVAVAEIQAVETGGRPLADPDLSLWGLSHPVDH